MHLKFLAHAAFLLESAAGIKILTDPYEPGGYDGAIGYKEITEPVDVITISHGHADHSYIAPQHRSAKIFNKAGKFSFETIEITGIAAFHDHNLGKDRGNDIIFKIKVDDITICHLGDLGHELSKEQIQELGLIDVLLIPAGGFFTVDIMEATRIMNSLVPKICIPMHFKTVNLGFDLAPVDEFIKNKNNVKIISASEIELQKDQLPVATEIWVLPPANLVV